MKCLYALVALLVFAVYASAQNCGCGVQQGFSFGAYGVQRNFAPRLVVNRQVFFDPGVAYSTGFQQNIVFRNVGFRQNAQFFNADVVGGIGSQNTTIINNQQGGLLSRILGGRNSQQIIQQSNGLGASSTTLINNRR